MSFCVTSGACLRCSFGKISSQLKVLPRSTLVEGKPAAHVGDFLPFVNIFPFGLCSSPLNPAFVETGGQSPCAPLIVSPWIPMKPTLFVNELPILHQSSKNFCLYGGIISVDMPLAVRTNVN